MISIIIPIYNVEDYIQECLDSILNQTYKNLQIIIVDDGSTDNSLKIVETYKSKFNNIIILSQKNKGVSEARNLAFKYIQGEYVMYIDSDDFLQKNMMEILFDEAKKHDADITICEYYVYYDKDTNKNFIQRYNVNFGVPYDKFYIMNMMLNFKLQGQLWHKLFKTKLLKTNNFQFEPGRYIQDIFPVFKMVSKSENIIFIDKPLYFYRQRETSTVHKKGMKIADDYYFAMKSIIKYINNNNIHIDIESLNRFKAIVLSNFIEYYTSADKNNNYNSFRNTKYYEMNINMIYLFFQRKLSVKVKLKVILWKIGLYSIFKNLKNKYKFIINNMI